MKIHNIINASLLPVLLFAAVGALAAQAENVAPAAEASAPEKAATAEMTDKAAKSEKGEKTEKGAKKKKPAVMKIAEDAEDPPPKEKDVETYQLSNKRMLDDYLGQDLRPFDRGEHMLISALVGGIAGSVVGGLVGFSMFDKNDETQSKNYLYSFGGAGAGAGAIIGIAVTFFETGKIAQFAIGKFLMKYSWYGAIGGGLLGAGIGFIPYSSSNDYGDILRYGGYGAGIGLVAGLTLFFFDLPEHLKLYTYRQADQNMIALALRF